MYAPVLMLRRRPSVPRKRDLHHEDRCNQRYASPKIQLASLHHSSRLLIVVGIERQLENKRVDSIESIRQAEEVRLICSVKLHGMI